MLDMEESTLMACPLVVNIYINNINALQFPRVGCTLLTDKITLKLKWSSKRGIEGNFL